MKTRLYAARHITGQVARQMHLCIYCLLPFGTVVHHKRYNVTQRPQGDHFIPYTLTNETVLSNLVASCQICNALKNSQVYESIEHAQRSLLSKRSTWRYHIEFVPITPITLNAWKWASEYAQWLADGSVPMDAGDPEIIVTTDDDKYTFRRRNFEEGVTV